ncbi:MAG: hypothetical protein ABUL63_00810 [Acidobacteriota bacterium]
MSRRRFIAGSAALLLAGLLAGAFPALGVSGPGIRVLAPAAGAELTAGQPATIAWEPTAGLESEEWEAFLSLDGGKTYTVRLTPHLDLAIRQFSFHVPDLPTSRARLLLRFGDERREQIVEAPGVFAIAPRLGWHELLPLGRIQHLSRGEVARDGQSGVVLWVEGTRDGRGLHEVTGGEEESSLAAVSALPSFVLAVLWPPLAKAELLPPPASMAFAAPPSGRLGEQTRAAPAAAAPVRLLIHRFNE